MSIAVWVKCPTTASISQHQTDHRTQQVIGLSLIALQTRLRYEQTLESPLKRQNNQDIFFSLEFDLGRLKIIRPLAEETNHKGHSVEL